MGIGGSSPKFNEEQMKKLDSGKPILLPGGIKIIKNKQTGMLEGVPEEWANNYTLPFHIDYHKLGSTKDMPQPIRADEELPAPIISLINSQPLEFSLYSSSHPDPPASNTVSTLRLTSAATSRTCPSNWLRSLTSRRWTHQRCLRQRCCRAILSRSCCRAGSSRR